MELVQLVKDVPQGHPISVGTCPEMWHHYVSDTSN